VLMGKVFQCQNRHDNGWLEDGYDSHKAPGEVEWIVFDCAQVLPCFIVEYTR